MHTFAAICLFLACTSIGATPMASIDTSVEVQQQPAPMRTHCTQHERVVFHCRIGAKYVSVCANRNRVNDAYSIQYRFGHLGAIEVSVPGDAERSERTVTFKRAEYASGYAVYLRFQTGRYAYYVFEASARGLNDPVSGASTRIEPIGVVVESKGVQIRRLNCTTGEGASLLSQLPSPDLPIAAKLLTEEEGINPAEIAFPR
jgi:hypothetical protein